MYTQCQNCGRELSIHIFSCTEEQEEDLLYCPQCVSYQQTKAEEDGGLSCSGCGSCWHDFLKRGHLACASCYDAFALQLEALIEKYHRITPGPKPFAATYKASSLARARSQELCEYVLTEGIEGSVYDLCGDKKELKRDIMVEENIIESVRLRMARNIEGLPYLGYLSEKQKEKLSRRLLAPQSILTLCLRAPNTMLRPAKLDTEDEDHLRVSWLFNWQSKRHCIKQLFNCLKQIELLDKLYYWQLHPDYGFLTACPALAGHAVRLSFQLQIPALRGNAEVWQNWHTNLSRAGYEIRSVEGEKSSVPQASRKINASKSKIQISKRHWSWGVSPREHIRPLMAVLESLVEAEYRARMSRRSRM